MCNWMHTKNKPTYRKKNSESTLKLLRWSYDQEIPTSLLWQWDSFPTALTFNLSVWLISAWSILPSYLWVCGLQADGKPLENRVEGEGEEKHERAERGMGLKVHVNVVAAALQVRTCAVAVAVTISSFWYQCGSLVMSSSHLLEVQNNPLQYEDCKEASSHNKLWKRETGLFETSIERLFHLIVKIMFTYHILMLHWQYSVQMTKATSKPVLRWTYLQLPSSQLCVDVWQIIRNDVEQTCWQEDPSSETAD